jgi:nucleoside-diphosphate-sugar epimerase
MTGAQHTLVTGFPTSFIARRMVKKILAAEPNTPVVCAVPKRFLERAQTERHALGADAVQRVELIEGDTAAMDFGMAGPSFLDLARRVRVVHHCAAVTNADVTRDVARRVNVGGAGEVLELCEAAPDLTRLVYWSTADVCGRRPGRVVESELPRAARFHNHVDESRHQAEQVIRDAMDHVPTTVLRPSIIVGDSRTGEIDRMEGPYLLILLMLSSPVDLRVPLPGRGDTPLNLVPIDYVVDAGYAISGDPRSVGRTFHLVDDSPPTARRVFELIAQETGRPGPVGSVPTQVATALLRAPGLERFSHVPRTFLEQLATEIIYDSSNTRELLAGSGIECPKAATYLQVMVEHVRKQQAQRPRKRRARTDTAEESDDPLA